MNVSWRNVDRVMRVAIALVCFSGAGNAIALTAMSDSEMAHVAGRDGITVNLETNSGITADQVRWTLDRNATDNLGNSLENSIRIGKANTPGDGLSIIPIDPGGAAATHPLDISTAIDAYSNSQGHPGLGLDVRWNRMRTRIDSMSVSDDTRSFGTMALDSAGRFALYGDGGVLNHANNAASLTLNIGNVDASDPNPSNWTINNPAQLFYRMGGPGSTEARLDNLGFLFDMHQGTVGIDSNGLVVKSATGSTTDFNLTFDIVANANSSFQSNPSIDLPLLYFGWRGGLKDFEFHLKPGGAWLPDGTVTQGLTASAGFNLASNFQFVAGEAGDDHSYLEFTDPQSLPHTLTPGRKDVEFGSLTLDAVSANQGVGGICYGGSNSPGPLSGCSAESYPQLPAQVIDLPPTDSGIALIARNWGLHAYSSKVSYRDGTNSAYDVANEGWALIYTLGDINSNIYLYPKTGAGIKMDVVTAVQTIGNTNTQRWENGTHLMIGDSNTNLAIGLVGADLLFVAKQMNINLSIGNGGLQFYTDQGARLQLRGMFAGGDIPNMTTPVFNSYLDMNLEFDQFAFNLLPDILGKKYLAFGGFFSFANLNNSFSNDAGGSHGHDDGSYISLAEPHFDELGVDFRLADITGDVEIPIQYGKGGKIDLQPASSASDHKPRLLIESQMNVGTLATIPGGAQGVPLEVGRVEFGGKNLGSIVIPSAHIRASLTLKQQ